MLITFNILQGAIIISGRAWSQQRHQAQFGELWSRENNSATVNWIFAPVFSCQMWDVKHVFSPDVCQEFELSAAPVPSVESAWLRSCHLPTARLTWWRPWPHSTGSTGHAFSKRPTGSWSPGAAWLCSATPWTLSSATGTAARTHWTKSPKRYCQNVHHCECAPIHTRPPLQWRLQC